MPETIAPVTELVPSSDLSVGDVLFFTDQGTGHAYLGPEYVNVPITITSTDTPDSDGDYRAHFANPAGQVDSRIFFGAYQYPRVVAPFAVGTRVTFTPAYAPRDADTGVITAVHDGAISGSGHAGHRYGILTDVGAVTVTRSNGCDACTGESVRIRADTGRELLPIGTAVNFTPSHAGVSTGTVDSHAWVADRPGDYHNELFGYRIAMFEGSGTIHRWADHQGETVTRGDAGTVTRVDTLELLPTGSRVRFWPGTDNNVGTITESLSVTIDGVERARYRIASEDGTRSYIRTPGVQSTPGGYDNVELLPANDVATPAADVPADAPVVPLPRTHAEAMTMVEALELSARITGTPSPAARELRALAAWLPGGKMNNTGHEFARERDLCGQYEAIVCPMFGWEPRRGMESSMAPRMATFTQAIAEFDANRASMPLPERVTEWLERYSHGGDVNRAVVDHAESHLEDHKQPALCELLDDVLGWDTGGLNDESEREYTVTVDVVRTITVTQTVTIGRTATDADTARDSVDQYDIADYLDSDGWTDEAGNSVYVGRTTRHDIDDWDIVDVDEA